MCTPSECGRVLQCWPPLTSGDHCRYEELVEESYVKYLKTHNKTEEVCTERPAPVSPAVK